MPANPTEPPTSNAEIQNQEAPHMGLRRFFSSRLALINTANPRGGIVRALRICIFFAGRFDAPLVAASAALLYVINYLNFTSPSIPWLGWWDQGEYLKTAHDLARFRISYSDYPLGYSILGGLSWRLLPAHPFFLPNLFCAVGIATLFYCSARRVVTRAEAVGLTALAVIANSYLWTWTLTIPWNVTPVAFVVFLCVYLVVFRKPTVRTMYLCGVAIAGAFFCRPWDAFFLCILYCGGLYALGTRRERFKAFSVLAASITVVAGLVITDYLVVFGKPFNPYLSTVAKQGLSFTHYPFKLYELLLDSNVLGTSAPPAVLDKMPWLVLIIPGVAVLIRLYGVPAVAWLTAASAMIGFYLSANGMIPSQFWDYWGFRYIVCWAPYSVLLAYLSVTRAWRIFSWKKVCAGFGASFIMLAFVGWRPHLVAQWQSTPGFASAALAVNKHMIGKSLFVGLTFPKPTTLDGLRLKFDRDLTVTVETALSTRAIVKADGRPLIAPWTEVVVHQEKDRDTLTIFFVNSRIVTEPVSRLDLEFDDIDNDTLTTVTAIRERFKPFAYLVHTYRNLTKVALEGEVTAYVVPTPWDVTGAVAGVPDGQIDFAVNCKLPSSIRQRVVDMEILLHTAEFGGRWATHSRDVPYDSLVFMPGYVEDNLGHPPPITNLSDVLRRGGQFSMLFKLPEAYRSLPLTLVGLDRDGREVFEKKMTAVE